jgi:hypothetical protein
MLPERKSLLAEIGRGMAVLLMCFLCAEPARAHPISVTRTHVYVTREKISVRLDVFAEDLLLFHNLAPNDRDFLEPDVIEEGIRKHKQFLLERFVIRDVQGNPLAGRSVGVKQAEMGDEGIALADLMSHRITFEMEYSSDTPPQFLTFSQHMVDDKLLVPAEMQLRVKQEGAGSVTHEVLYPDTPHTVRFSWDHPALPAEASDDEWDNWYEQQKEETLGITSYSSVYSILYIHDFEVRHEILVPLLTLEDSVLIARDDNAFLEVQEQDAARRQIEAFFASGNPVEVDGVQVQPVVQRVDFYGLDFKDFARQAERRRVSMASARVGIILSYSTKGPPDAVKVTWDRFNQFIWTVNMIVYAYEDTQRAMLSRVGMENTYVWQNPGREPPPPLRQVDAVLPPRPALSLPTVSLTCLALLPALLLVLRWRGATARSYLCGTAFGLCCAAAVWPFGRYEVPNPLAAPPSVSDAQALTIFAALHKNVYRAFDYRNDDQIYDALARSVDGPLLRDLYLEIRRDLEMQEQGGAISRVRAVDIVAGEKKPLPGDEKADRRSFGYRCRWTVDGTVEHWGHIHSRTNAYEAEFCVQPRAGAWKITDMQVVSEERIQFETSLRGM